MAAAAAPPSRLFATHEAALAALDRLPRGLWLGGLTHSRGRLEMRLAAVERWQHALLAGCLPDETDDGWPMASEWPALCASFRELELTAFCAERPELVEMLLQSLLFHLDLIVDYRDRGADEAEAVAIAIDAFRADWAERSGWMRALIEVFGDLGDLVKHCRWDMLRGLLRSSGWQEVVRIRKLIEELPELARLIRSLGRRRPSEESDAASRRLEPVIEPALARSAATREVRVPDLPGETRSVRRSGRIARMLPAEAMLLAHPRLRLVWHARHAERTLLTYEDDDTMSELHHEEVEVLRPSLEPAPEKRFELGPMLICVDTSGSMQGGAETVAKAVVLEAVRAAHADGRACHVFAFSGPDEVVESVLSLDDSGLQALTRFLGQSFSGGTDIGGPLQRTLAKLEEREWQLADLLIASDGEFGATPELAQRLRAAKLERGLRVQGVLIGDRETIGLLELTDDVFWVRDWRRFGGRSAESPVHSKSLTATYFPGALRTPENLEATCSGVDASAVVRAGRSAAQT